MLEKLKSRLNFKLTLGLGAKLVAGFLIVAIVPMVLAAITAIYGIDEGIEDQAQSAINSDLNSANQILSQKVNEVSIFTSLMGADESIAEDIKNENMERLERVLFNHFQEQNFSFLTLTNGQGDVIFRASSEITGDSLSEHPLLRRVLGGSQVEGIVVFEESFLENEGLAEEAHINIAQDGTGSRREETRGMTIMSATPLYDEEGRIEGMLVAGDLINNNFEIVDEVGELLDVTATIFLDDLRISTNVRTLAGDRATGTTVSQEVANTVLNRGERFLGRAFVVTEDYITAYDPIYDPMGETIGINYVGIREAPFLAMKRDNLNRFVLIAIISFILAVVLALFITRGITNPVKNLTENMKQAEEGDLTVQAITKAKDELGQLATSFNHMLSGQEGMIKKVLQTADNVATSSQTLSSAVEESNAAMQEIASTVEGEIAQKAQDIALISNQASESGTQTQKTAAEGEKAVEEAVDTMKEIDQAASEVGTVIGDLDEASKKIGVIVNTITGIADQTNLLALNAAIEDARAGEQGKGFAVVAEEVRKLAEGSSSAAGEIGSLISDIQGRTGNAVEKMNIASEIVSKGTQLGEAAREHLQEIRKAVDEVGEFIKEISAAVEEQSASSEEIAASTQEQTGVLESISSTTNELSEVAEELNNLMNQFKINQS